MKLLKIKGSKKSLDNFTFKFSFDSTYFNIGEQSIFLTEDAFNYIMSHEVNKNEFLKSFYSFENKEYYTINDIILEQDKIPYLYDKIAFYYFINSRFRFNMYWIMSIKNYYTILSYFKNEGFELSSETKDDDYIEILNSDDTQKISNLQQLLFLVDNINEYNWFVKKIVEIKNAVGETKESLYKSMLTNF